MNKYLIVLFAFVTLFMVGCASSGGATSSGGESNGGLPEIAAYDDPAYDPLPDMVATEAF